MKIKISFWVILIGILIGLFITIQLKSRPHRTSSTPLASLTLLKENQEKLSKEQADLKNQISTLQKEISQIQERLKKTQATSREKVEELETLKIKAGMTEVKGAGVIITLDDSAKYPATSNSIAHAADMRDLVNFLWTIGAQAMAINNERIVSTSSIDCLVNTVMVNNTKMTTPFIILVVGEPKTLREKVESRENLPSIWQRVKEEDLKFEILENYNLTLPAYKGSLPVDYAQVK